jgi:hypothetical protein
MTYNESIMRANPGGIVAPEDVIGRDDLIEQLWHILDTQSIVLTSERRVGKTSVIRKMFNSAGSGRVCFFRDLEGFRSPREFIDGVYADVQPILSKKDKARLMMWKLVEKLEGAEIGSVKVPQIKQHWKDLLSVLFQDIFTDENRPVVYFWDELPLFIYNVKENSGEQDAMELLDTLRGLRQKYSNLRMVFTGSVGLHQVVGSLRKVGYANDPTNDMATVEVPPLDPHDGLHLANLLITGERIDVVGDVIEVSDAVSRAAGHIPYYIHCLVARLCSSRQVESKGVGACLQQLLSDPNDPAHFQYYQSRLTTYYGPVEAELALHALDALSSLGRPASFAELLNLVKHKTPTPPEETFREVLSVLLKDHYLLRNLDGTYCFRYSIVEHWWRYTRG